MAQSLLKLCLPGGIQNMDERLEQLVIKARQQESYPKEQQIVLANLVDEILRVRPICRPLKGQLIFEVQQDIYEQVRQQLLQEIGQELNRYNPQQTRARVWASRLRDRAFSQVLDDPQLKQLALEAQRHPSHSELRRYALGELVKAIRLSGKLCHPHRQKFSPDFYELLYEEAVIETLIYVCQNIDKYDPQRGKEQKFMTWVNFRLDKLVIECRRKFNHLNVKELPSLNDLEKIPQPQESPCLSEKVRQYVEEDAEHIFRQTHIRNRPDANFRAIAIARFLGKSWEEIASQLEIAVPTLSSFFQRCCRKFAPKFKQELQN
jgi:DNA-directed RNA polymerase specialized sigma24 family protein